LLYPSNFLFFARDVKDAPLFVRFGEAEHPVFPSVLPLLLPNVNQITSLADLALSLSCLQQQGELTLLAQEGDIRDSN